MLRDVVIQLVEIRGEGAWKQMRYDLEVACSEMRGAEAKLVEVSLPPSPRQHNHDATLCFCFPYFDFHYNIL